MKKITLDEYIEVLLTYKKLWKGNKLKLIHAGDDEGNWFQEINYLPTIGRYENGEFEALTAENCDDIIANAVCVN